jgi:RNA polymerase sigma factor (sigma-70 family)
MRCKISNEEVMEIFREIERIKNENPADTKQVEKLHNKIIDELAFLVFHQAKPYKRFQNYEDIVQEGYVGLLKAVRRFDYKRFPNFFVFADQWIWNNVKKAASKFDIVYDPTKKRVIYAEPSRFDKEADTTPEESFIAEENSEIISRVLSQLSDKERIILEKTYGIKDGKECTLREIGPQLNLTHERIRQIKNEVLNRLKDNKDLQNI